VRTAVDDAGSGIANFAHILELHPDFVKLDIGLVRGIDTDPARRAMAVAMCHFAGDTGCQLIAEGIETKDEAHTLQALGVDFGQGYWYERPHSIETLVAHPLPRPTRIGSATTAHLALLSAAS
jgi:EAL domain-containing protein (putative c-di-GMP-specific phosphodiesterase class I)